MGTVIALKAMSHKALDSECFASIKSIGKKQILLSTLIPILKSNYLEIIDEKKVIPFDI